MNVREAIEEKQSNLGAVLKDSYGAILFRGTVGELSVSKYWSDKVKEPAYFDCKEQSYIILIIKHED